MSGKPNPKERESSPKLLKFSVRLTAGSILKITAVKSPGLIRRDFGNPQEVSPELFGLIERSGEFFEKTGGAFDITLLPRVGYNHLLLDSQKKRVGFRVPEMEIDLGGLGRVTCVTK